MAFAPPRPVDWQPVWQSKRVLAAAYWPEERKFFVRFKDKTPWVYHGVPASGVERFNNAQSKGAFFKQYLDGFRNERVIECESPSPTSIK